MEALVKLPTDSKDAVLRLLARPNFNPHNVPWRNVQEFNQYVDSVAAQDWMSASVNILVKGTEYTFDFSYRSSLEPLAELVRSRKERLGAYVCPWIGYNDGTILERDGERKAYPVVVFCPLQPLSHMLSRDGYRRVALLPSVDASSFPGSNLDDKRDAGLISDLQGRLDAACIRVFLAIWKEASYRFQSLAVGLGGKSWAFPKFYDMYKFEELICEFGSVPIASASYGERSHKDFKAAKLFTNNHKATLMSQISKQVRQLDGVRQDQEDMYEAPGPRAMSVAQKALKYGRPQMTVRGQDVDYRSFHQDAQYRHDSLSDTELELLQQQPELRQLYKAVCLMLAGYPKRNPRDPEATLLARLPKLSYPKVKACTALGVAYERRVGDDMVPAVKARNSTCLLLPQLHRLAEVPLLSLLDHPMADAGDWAPELLARYSIKQSLRVKDYYRDGVARPYQSLRWATVAGETLKNYKLIARRLCDRWQADLHQEGSTGQSGHEPSEGGAQTQEGQPGAGAGGKVHQPLSAGQGSLGQGGEREHMEQEHKRRRTNSTYTSEVNKIDSVRKLFNKTVATLFDFHYPRNQQVAKWVINAKVLQVEKRQYPSTGHSGDTYVTFFDNTIGPVKGLIHAAAKLAELADRGRVRQTMGTLKAGHRCRKVSLAQVLQAMRNSQCQQGKGRWNRVGSRSTWSSVRKLFEKTVAALVNFQHPRNQHVAKWVINAKVLQVKKRQYPSTGHSGETYVTFFDNATGTVKGLINAATKLAELADRGAEHASTPPQEQQAPDGAEWQTLSTLKAKTKELRSHMDKLKAELVAAQRERDTLQAGLPDEAESANIMRTLMEKARQAEATWKRKCQEAVDAESVWKKVKQDADDAEVVLNNIKQEADGIEASRSQAGAALAAKIAEIDRLQDANDTTERQLATAHQDVLKFF
eukprot:jgi/Astpho2/1128/fgenesh1_pg.00020_%23_24_t